MGKKIWLSVHPRNFGSHVTVRPPSLASVRVYTTGKITQSTGVTTRMDSRVLARNCAATRTFREKKQQQSRVFLRLSFNVYTDIDNRERARARDKKQRRRILLEKQHDILYRR